MASVGAVYVAFGPLAVIAARQSIASLKAHNDGLPIAVICRETEADPLRALGAQVLEFSEHPGWGARWAKLATDILSPFDSFLYLDADTIVNAPLQSGFEILGDGWDVAITASVNQETDWLWQATEEERGATLEEICNPLALSLQGGLMFVNKNSRTAGLFSAWRDEWKRWGHIDQAALMRAINRAPVRVWLLGRDWNGGSIVEHKFGSARA